MKLSLVILAAGLSTRYGGLKQLEPVGPGGAVLFDYGIYDAVRAGFSRFVLVVRPEIEPLLRQHIDEQFGGGLEVDYVAQQLDALPKGFTVPPGRRKPWGTGHAVLAVRRWVGEPYVVMNADDFYGAEAFSLLAGHLRSVGGTGKPDFAAAGYRLRDTLSPSGGVSRAICELDNHGYLKRVTEVKNIREDAGTMGGVTLTGQRLALTGDEVISMNLWAATPAAFPLLERQFINFLDETGSELNAEFLLSTAVNDLIDCRQIRVKVIPTPGPWLGVTFAEDRSVVMEKLSQLVGEGEYPENLAAPGKRSGERS